MRARLAILAVLVALAACGREPAAPARLEFQNADHAVAYIGQEACRQCHYERYGTYLRTGMGRSFYPLAGAEIVEDFAEDNELVVEPSGMHYRMEQRDGKFYQRQFLVDSRGAEIAAEEHELRWVVGSNHHSRSYLLEIGGKLFQAPMCWYPQASRWDLCPGYEFKNDHFFRETSQSCLHCHNGRMTVVAGERNLFESPYPHGIDCERCHGPGALHVERWSGGAQPTGDPDTTIVNPRRLPPAERAAVCYQCHLGDAKATVRVGRPERELSDFRPSQPLTDYLIPFHYAEQTEHGFGLSAQADRMILSRCFTETGGKLECLTCHNPHVTVYREDRPQNHFNQRCLGCHTLDSCTAPPAVRQATRPADDCTGCHMRKAEPDDQRHTAFTDHWIRRDAANTPADERESYAVAAVFPEHLATLPPAEQAFYRGRASQLLALDAPMARREAMWREAEREFESAIEGGFDGVDSWFFLGKVRHYLGRKQEAAQAFERAHARDPAHHDAAFAWGQALAARGDAGAALEVFRGMLEHDANDAMALAEAGRAATTLGDIPNALGFYERAIAAEPWQASLHLNRGMLLASQGRFEEAAREAEAAVRLDPDEPTNWEFYAKVMQAAGRPAEAREGSRLHAHLERTAKSKARMEARPVGHESAAEPEPPPEPVPLGEPGP
jgi:tetratricopeptide (TPR) repeat protein